MPDKKRCERLFLLLCLAVAVVCAGLAFRFAVPLRSQKPQTLPDSRPIIVGFGPAGTQRNWQRTHRWS